MTEREHSEFIAREWLETTTAQPFNCVGPNRAELASLADLVERERATAREQAVERAQAELDRELLRLGCVHDPDWGNPDLREYQIAPREHVRRMNRGRDALLVLVREDIHVDWALMAWSGALADDPGAARFELVMHGHGPSSTLREPRHTYFGPTADQAGYVFYVQPKLIDWAFDQLREFFDFEGDEP